MMSSSYQAVWLFAQLCLRLKWARIFCDFYDASFGPKLPYSCDFGAWIACIMKCQRILSKYLKSLKEKKEHFEAHLH